MCGLEERELDGFKLLAPETFWFATDEERAMVCNGCGPIGLEWLIPDEFLGCSFDSPCDIHDWMYTFGGVEDKQFADLVFLNNMIRVVRAQGGILSYMREQRAWIYYRMVRDFGYKAFWENKKRFGSFSC